MRKIVLLWLLAMGAMAVKGQARLGFLGGLHSSNILESNKLPGWDTAVKKYLDSRSGFELGLIVEVPIGKKGFYFQPAMTYITKGRNYDRNNDSIKSLLTDTIYNKAGLNLDYIEIPLNLTYKFALTDNGRNSLFFSAGPYISFIYGGNLTISSLTTNPQQFNSETNSVNVGKGAGSYTTTDLGVNGKIGFELGTMMISGYYSRGLTSIYHADYPGTFHHTVFGISLGFWLSPGTLPPVRKKELPIKVAPEEQNFTPPPPAPATYHGSPVLPPPPPPVVMAAPLQVPVIREEDTVEINYIAHNVLFNSSSDLLKDSSFGVLDELADRLAAHPEWHLTIEGHTDNSGTAAHNMVLSQKRADAVRDYLVKKGIPANRLTAIGYGQTRPVGDNRTLAGKAANRRVELKISIEKSQF